MIVTYQPAGEDAHRWEFRPETVRVAAAEIIEKRAGITFDEWRQAVMKGSAAARRVLLWHLLQRKHPALRFDDVDYALDELTVEFTKAELTAWRSQVATTRQMTDEQRELALRALDDEIETAPDGEDDPGKALWPSSD